MSTKGTLTKNESYFTECHWLYSKDFEIVKIPIDTQIFYRFATNHKKTQIVNQLRLLTVLCSFILQAHASEFVLN